MKIKHLRLTLETDYIINTLPNDKIVDMSKLKAFADDKLDVTEEIENCPEKGRKQCGKKEKMLVSSIFSFSHNVFKRPPFPQCFQKAPFLGPLKVGNVWYSVKSQIL